MASRVAGDKWVRVLNGTILSFKSNVECEKGSRRKSGGKSKVLYKRSDSFRSHTGYTQKNGAVSKVNKKFISQFTRAQIIPPAEATVQISHALQKFASHAYCGATGLVSKMASQQEKSFCVLRFEVSRSVITVLPEFRARFGKDAPCMVCLF